MLKHKKFCSRPTVFCLKLKNVIFVSFSQMWLQWSDSCNHRRHPLALVLVRKHHKCEIRTQSMLISPGNWWGIRAVFFFSSEARFVCEELLWSLSNIHQQSWEPHVLPPLQRLWSFVGRPGNPSDSFLDPSPPVHCSRTSSLHESCALIWRENGSFGRWNKMNTSTSLHKYLILCKQPLNLCSPDGVGYGSNSTTGNKRPSFGLSGTLYARIESQTCLQKPILCTNANWSYNYPRSSGSS